MGRTAPEPDAPEPDAPEPDAPEPDGSRPGEGRRPAADVPSTRDERSGPAGRGAGTPRTAAPCADEDAPAEGPRPRDDASDAAAPADDATPDAPADAPRAPELAASAPAHAPAHPVPGRGAGHPAAGHPATGRPVPNRPPARRPGTARRGPVDPVKSLLHRHRDLCERAVDPLEIAAGLEAHGLTDRTAARYRHRDVFSLAEELYARVPDAEREPAALPSGPSPVPPAGARTAWTLRALLPGAACFLAVTVLRLTDGVFGAGTRFALVAAGVLLVHLALRAALRTGPLRAAGGSGRAGLYTCWLLAFAAYGEGLLAQIARGGPDGPWDGDTAPLLGLSLAVPAGAWCAHLFAVQARRKLDGSRALEEFGAGVRPVLLVVVVLFACALVPPLVAAHLGLGAGAVPLSAAALGVLFFLARLEAVHGLTAPAVTALAAACAVEAAAPALLLAGRLPGLAPLARPVDVLIAAGGTGAVPALACTAAALGLLLHASAALARASAHAARRP
ncbi:hypothetical protein [uncultured Streptomyces sp.]|uniref:hypothetical protein n=1 Tax=uncultured Streptomyces sp. TaxID=174707 RepID=UPI00262CE9FB|nr:hypothetical protein [uncultured Streptomyces sp.]